MMEEGEGERGIRGRGNGDRRGEGRGEGWGGREIG
jgi:hypothetical protein